MCTPRWTTRAVLLAISLIASACARRVPQPIGPSVTLPVPGARDSPTWADAGRHVRILADYDGRLVNVLSAASGEGSARSYLGQRRDIAVMILDGAGKVLREFYLPDPRDRRVWDKPPGHSIDAAAPRIGWPRERLAPEALRARSAGAQTSESSVRVAKARFELFVPRLDRAESLEFHAGAPSGQLLGRVDLAGIP